MKKSKQLLLITALLFIWELPVIAQQPTDTTYIFRFVPNDDMFYVPWNGNDRSLHQLLNILEKNKKQLQAGQMYISVSSYAASANDILTSERMAYIRNNRIKSELITQGGLTEQMFVTDRAILSSYGKEKLEPLAILCFAENIRKEAKEIFSYMRQNGIKVKIISGDSGKTVYAIARAAGAECAGGYIDVFDMDQKALEQAVEHYSVFGRVTPQQKKQIVHYLKTHGKQ